MFFKENDSKLIEIAWKKSEPFEKCRQNMT